MPNPKLGNDWKCAFCESKNRGPQPACRVCKRPKEDSLRRLELAEKERARKEQEAIEQIEAEKAAADADAAAGKAKREGKLKAASGTSSNRISKPPPKGKASVVKAAAGKARSR